MRINYTIHYNYAYIYSLSYFSKIKLDVYNLEIFHFTETKAIQSQLYAVNILSMPYDIILS